MPQPTCRSSLVPILAAALLLAAAPGAAEDADGARLLRFPDVHRDFVVFVHGGDVWRAPVAGGVARRLTSHPGQELFPKISRDGRLIAFSAEHSGTRQVYVMPAEGGEPRQLTFHSDVGRMPPRGGFDGWILGWTPAVGDSSGKVLVRMNRTPWGRRMGRYFLVDPDGGLETPLPLPHGGSASLSPDGRSLAYCPVDREFRTWKRTRGGRAQDVWIYDLEAHRSHRLTTDRGTDNFPMWAGDVLYFTSDRDDVLNLYALDLEDGEPAGAAPRKVTDFPVEDVLWPSLGPDAIVFVNGGGLHRLDLATEEVTPIPIEIRSELPYAVPHFVDAAENVRSAELSPSGVRALFGARGEIFTVPAGEGPTRNLTHTPGIREIDPTWSPDGRWIAYLSDRTGEYELYLRPHDGDGPERQVTEGGDVWRFAPEWSPDSQRLAFGDRDRRLMIVEVASGELTEVDRGRQGDLTVHAWSPDGRHLAYEKAHDTRLPAIWLYSLDDGESRPLGSGLTFDFEPAWSADGRHLFFLSNRDFQIRFSDFEFNYLYDRAARVFVAALDPDAPPLFPLENDDETPGESAMAEADEGKGDGDAPARIAADGFDHRTVAVPGLEAGDYQDLRAVPGALFYLHGPGTDDLDPELHLYRYDLEKREAERILEGVMEYHLSADGEKLLYRTEELWGVAEVGADLDPEEGELDLAGLRLKVDPEVEWRQMFHDGWRIARDFFYDSDMHGVDWPAMRERYGALVPHLAHRAELDFLFGEMLGELEAGHTYVAAGDEPEVERVEGGLLGCEFEPHPSGYYRIARIFRGENWDEGFRSPLTEPGVEVPEGWFLIAVDGEEIRHPDHPYRPLEGKAGVQVELLVAAEPSTEGARRVRVETIDAAGEQNLRYLDWVRSRIELTEKLSGGRIGYVHLPNTAFEGNRMLQKLFYGQADKEALVIDDRYNGGGFIPDRMIEMLSRRTLSYWDSRDVEAFRTPGFAHDGPKVMLMNGYSSSGGDALPYYFKQAGLGPLVGTRTWGGLIGLSGNPDLMDGGAVLIPTFRIYDAEEGDWVVENEGVVPDVEVHDLPEKLRQGHDPSLEKGIEILLQELEKKPAGRPEAPEPPDMAG